MMGYHEADLSEMTQLVRRHKVLDKSAGKLRILVTFIFVSLGMLN